MSNSDAPGDTTRQRRPSDHESSAVLAALDSRLELWANQRTNQRSAIATRLLEAKRRTLRDFFAFVGRLPHQVTPADTLAWQRHLRRQGSSGATIYAYVSRVSSFFSWAQQVAAFPFPPTSNPVNAARPPMPRAYATSTPLAEEQIQALLAVVRERADLGEIIGLRDYALLVWYLLTGMRREEIAGLRWGDVALDEHGGTILSVHAQGGVRRTRAIQAPELQESLLAYLRGGGRLAHMLQESALWVRHHATGGLAQEPLPPLSSKAIEQAFQRYARRVGIAHLHLHQLRHSYALLVGEETGDVEETREALGLARSTATQTYLRRLALERDTVSRRLAARLGLGMGGRSSVRPGAEQHVDPEA